MAIVSRALSFLALGGTAVALAPSLVACGSRSTLYAFGGRPSPGDDAGDDSGADASPPPIDAPVSCEGGAIQVTLNAPNLYFVLDHSSSMNEMNKWSNVRQAVAQLMMQIGAGARMGAMMFPGTASSSSCSVGVEIMSLRQGDTQGVVASTFLAATTQGPNGGTPTAATLESLVPKLTGLPGSTYVILATDGGPNCSTAIPSCDAYLCTANIDQIANCSFTNNCCASDGISCLDDTATVKAAADLASAGIQTYVLGIPGSDSYANVLDRLAIAGNTARTSEPLYYQVTTADDAALLSAFQQVVQQTGAGCTFRLAHTPFGLNGERVMVGGSPVPEGGPDGWSLQGTTLTLSGSSCDAVKSSGAPSLQFFEGCPE